MKPKNNKSWIKRKHRKGVKPVRKSSLKINLQELPQRGDLLPVSWGLSERLSNMLNAVAPVPHLSNMNDLKDPVWTAAFHKSKREFDAYLQAARPIEKAIRLLEKATWFLIENKQVSTATLANEINAKPETLAVDRSRNDTAVIAATWEFPNN